MSNDLNKLELAISSELRYQMMQCNTLLDELKNELISSELVSAEVFKLPVTLMGEEHKKILKTPVQHIKGNKAFFMAIQSYGKIYAEENISRKAVYRLPGYVQVNGDREKINAIINQLNEHKLLFKDEVQKIKSSKSKHDLIHGLFPGLITKQLYRKLYTIEENISSIGFCWANRFVTYKTTKEDVIACINKQKKHVPVKSNPDEWIDFLNREITDIQRLPGSVELRFKRPAKVSVVANIDRKKAAQISAHLPVIVVQGSPLRITPLYDFDASFRRCVRADSRIGGKPIIDRLNLYAKA